MSPFGDECSETASAHDSGPAASRCCASRSSDDAMWSRGTSAEEHVQSAVGVESPDEQIQRSAMLPRAPALAGDAARARRDRAVVCCCDSAPRFRDRAGGRDGERLPAPRTPRAHRIDEVRSWTPVVEHVVEQRSPDTADWRQTPSSSLRCARREPVVAAGLASLRRATAALQRRQARHETIRMEVVH